MTTLLIGGDGFIGGAVAGLLAERGDDLRVVRDAPRAARGAGGRRTTRRDRPGAGAPRPLDIGDRRALRRALRGAGQVFHAAGLRRRQGDPGPPFAAAVGRVRVLLEECLRAGVERVVLTSSFAAVGPAPAGRTVDERALFTAGDLRIPYVAAAREVEVEGARLAAQGLPLVCVNPCVVFGRGDEEGRATRLVRRFLRGGIPFYPAGALNVVAVEDVARGHVLAGERGRAGERYLLGNRNYTLDRLFADLSRLSGVAPPELRLPGPVAVALAEALEAGAGGSPLSPAAMRSMSRWWTYRSTKAERELGWRPAPHEDTVQATVEWYLERERHRLDEDRRRRPLPVRLGAAAAGRAAGLSGVRRAARLAGRLAGDRA